ncbi:AMP-binding protein [Acidisphaera rubrifaciens]|uniref:AMP-binding protein n=1 Tax=Acidisphaera rubrifaciens HS-AP3 TaxID=1231350 RepID=A0A0D6P367_9PROT|nr:AMP-binding protein [Acidisphaera rubrifaciens]GAN76200.1 AMP-binding protein [Acidisphaera rubrifaciens HS-AP3]
MIRRRDIRLRDLADIAAVEAVPFETHEPESTVPALIARIARHVPARAALRFLEHGAADAPVRDLSFAALDRHRIQAANVLHGAGLRPDGAAALLLPILPETFELMFGAHSAGIACPINFLLEPGHIITLLRQARARVLCAPDPDVFPGVWEKVAAVRAALPDIAVLRVGGPPLRGDIDAPHYETLRDRAPDALVFDRAIAPEEVAALMHTGGTTSAPKLARHTHRGLVATAWTNAEALHLSDADTLFAGLPPFHVGGAYCGGLAPLSRGATLVMLTAAGMRNPDVVRNYWRLVARFRPTVLPMVPTSWAATMQVPCDPADHAGVRAGNVGGAPMPVAVAEGAQARLGVPVIEGWGMTELHGFGTMNPIDGDVRLGSVGLRLPYVELIVAEVAEGRIARVLPPGTIGHVLVRGRQVFAGYVDPAHDRGTWVEDADGIAPRAPWSAGGRWLDTGDLGRLDADGYVWLTGRAKDLIIRGAHNIDPQLIEEALHRHPAVQAAAAVGRPDRHAGEMPVAYVQLRPGMATEGEALRAYLRETLEERAAVPAAVTVVEQMPLTGVGKIFKPALRALAAREALTAATREALGPGAVVEVDVGPHPAHGTLATVRLPPGTDVGARAAVEAALAGFTLRSVVLSSDDLSGG